jgi:hypothetical protein
VDGRGEANEGEYQIKLFLGVKFLVRRERKLFGADAWSNSWSVKRRIEAGMDCKKESGKSGYGLSGFSIDFRCRKVG